MKVLRVLGIAIFAALVVAAIILSASFATIGAHDLAMRFTGESGFLPFISGFTSLAMVITFWVTVLIHLCTDKECATSVG